MKVGQAKRIAFGSTPTSSTEEYNAAWQWLYDNKVELEEADIYFLDKLICDGAVIPKQGYFD